MNGTPWNKIETQKLIGLYENSTKKVLIENFPNRSYDAIKLKAEKLQLKKKINEQIEGDLSVLLQETPETYYWIGFLYADGYFNHSNNRLKLTLQSRDGNQVKKFAEFITEVRIMDRFLFPKIVEKFLIKSKKTYNPPPNLSFLNTKEKLVSFIIGFIDADGYVYRDKRKNHKNEINIVIKLHSSWKDILQLMSCGICNLLKFPPTTSKINNQGYAWVAFYRKDIIKFLCQQIKELNLPVMERKWNPVLTFYRNEI